MYGYFFSTFPTPNHQAKNSLANSSCRKCHRIPYLRFHTSDMKHKFVLSFLLLLSYFAAFSQIKGVTLGNPNQTDTTTVKINSTFLLLGTLNDYIKHNYGARPNQFDRYYDYEKPLMAFVDSLAQKDFKVQFAVEKGAFISEKLSRKMDSLYHGHQINRQLMDSPSKSLSFLLGIYLRYGQKIDDGFYKIQLANSPKHENVYDLLGEMGCERIFYKKLRNIPTGYIFYFRATGLMKNYFDSLQGLNEKLQQALLNSLPESGNRRAQYREAILKENLKVLDWMR